MNVVIIFSDIVRKKYKWGRKWLVGNLCILFDVLCDTVYKKSVIKLLKKK